jgi:hypothetical protein
VIWLCCHTGVGHLRPETVGALTTWASDDEIRFVNVGGSDLRYGLVLASAWGWSDDLAIIEPDIMVRGDVVEAFHSCREGYCCFPYALTTDVMPALGCTMFGFGFRRKHPDAMNEALEEPAGHGPGHFRSIDVALQRYVLARNGIQPHVHVPAVTHLNGKQALIEGASPEPILEVPLW